MNSRPGPPLIGLTGRDRRAAQVEGLPSTWAALTVDVHVAAYAAKVAEAGGIPVTVPQVAPVEELADRLAGLVLTGGADIEPARYRAAADPDLGPVEVGRDDFELRLLEAVVTRGRPVLGICRGLQLINVWAGGTLHQHVPGHMRHDQPPEALVHDVHVDRSAPVARLYPPVIAVNSYHHQTVAGLGHGLVASGRAPDGTIEIIEHEHHRMLAVQWHPELLEGLDPCFRWLIEQARPG